MAPKRGGGGSSSKGGSGKSSSTCDLCSYPLQLEPDGYSSPNARAILALEVILAIVVVVCMILVAHRPWLKLDQKKDRFKYYVFQLMASTQLLYLIFDIVDSILHQVEVETTYGYLITYIFRSLFFRVSEVCMIALILRCLEGARNAMKTTHTKLRIINFLIIGLLSILALVAWAIYTKGIADTLSSSSSSSTAYAAVNVDTAFSALVFVVSLGMVALVAFLAIKKAIPPASIAILAVIVGAYWLSALVNLIFDATYYYSFTDYTVSLGTANGVISVLAAIAIFITLAMLSRLSNSKTRQAGTKPNQPGLNDPSAPPAWSQAPKNDHQSFTTDTSYQGGSYGNNQWSTPNNNNQYVQQTSYDPAAQPLYPSQTYNPPQQVSHVYDSGAQYPPMQQPPAQLPEMQQPQRFYGNNHAYSAVPQASG